MLLLIPCFWRCPAGIVTFYFPKVGRVPVSAFSLGMEPLFNALLFLLFVTALAGPLTYDRLASRERSGRDLVLVLDTSGSMAESGFSEEKPDERKYDLLLEMVERFLQKRHDDNVGPVIFGTFAYAASPVTYDLEALRQILKMTDVGVAGQSTAIGEGIDQALRSLRFGHAKEKVIVLITDGYQNAGSVSVKQAVERAKKEGVKIYTIGLGTPKDFDAKLLQRIADETGGKMFAAEDASELEGVFEELDSLEPSPIRSKAMLNPEPWYWVPLLAAMVLLIGRLAFRRGA